MQQVGEQTTMRPVFSPQASFDEFGVEHFHMNEADAHLKAVTAPGKEAARPRFIPQGTFGQFGVQHFKMNDPDDMTQVGSEPAGVRISELWVYPVKGCRGIKVESSKLVSTGLEFDRHWCVVDVDGVIVAAGEAISKRKLPALAKVVPSFNADMSELTLSAPDMDDFRLPTSLDAYNQEEDYRVECSGKSTTTGVGWSLGYVEGKRCAAASKWLNEFLNRVDPKSGSGLRCSGKPKETTFAVIRAGAQGLAMSSYPPIFPIIEKSKVDPEYKERFAKNEKFFSDFAPFLMVNKASQMALTDAIADDRIYPINSFRGNIVVAGAEAWAEETWRRVDVFSRESGKTIQLRWVKPCPRCSVTCRDETTGEYLYPREPMKLWKVLKRLFPRKYDDPEWGSWSGGYFGAYFGHAGQEGMLRVGDSIIVTEMKPWDAHLQGGKWWQAHLLWIGPIALGLAAVTFAMAAPRRNTLQGGTSR